MTGDGRPSSPVGGGADIAMLALIAVLAAAVALIWLWGGLAGAVLGHGWPPSPHPAGLLAVLVRLPGHLSDPAAAWPAPARQRLPGSAGLYATLAALLAAVGAARGSGRQDVGATARVRGPQRWRPLGVRTGTALAAGATPAGEALLAGVGAVVRPADLCSAATATDCSTRSAATP